MTLFLSSDALGQRKRDLQDPTAVGGLAASLQRELHAALDVPVPDGKSRLTRNGGRCVKCTVLLLFDPRSPHAHTCPQCGAVYTDAVHHEWWLMNGHLWTAEQATRAAALACLLDDDAAAARADAILATYSARYLSWPNRDNALGPTRPFFSTYLESIWLLHLATALDLRIAATGTIGAVHREALERVIAPSAKLIAGFDEGRSNRQVWHAAALLAASDLLGDAEMRDRAGDSLVSLLRDGLHTDGSWYEGENYHLFAHRGLLSGVALAERAGVEIPRDLLERFEMGFAAPFRTMLPDGTFPARRDSQYAVALRQYRTADWAECGIARCDTPELRAALASLYATWPAEGETHRWASSGDAERNMPGVRLTRADCSWRALLLARLELPPLTDAVPHSELLEGQGLAVFRRDGGRFWVGLDYGDPGDGHGHPDRLNLVIATQESRWLDDVGTGSYTSPTLSWYRSSMAHNAPMVNGQDQGAAPGRLLAHDEQGDLGWVSAEFIDPVSGVRFVRTVVVTGDHLLDEVTWTSDIEVTVDVPFQARTDRPIPAGFLPFVPATSQDDWLTDCTAKGLAAGEAAALICQPLPSPASAERTVAAHEVFFCAVWSASAAVLWRAGTIGPPAGRPHGLVSLRQQGRSGRSVRVVAWPMPPAHVDFDGDSMTVYTIDDYDAFTTQGTVHTRIADGWRVERRGHADANVVASAVLLGERRPRIADIAPPAAPEQPGAIPMRVNSTLVITLGESSYRPTEEPWRDAGMPTAHVSLLAAPEGFLSVHVRVDLGRDTAFAPLVVENPLDNELADVNSDGVQLHWRSALSGVWNSAIAVPDGDAVRLTAAEGTLDGLGARWMSHAGGYTVIFTLPWASREFEFDCCVNDRPANRERRRGQLVLSGARGEFAYLRGARQSPDHALHVVFDPASP